jgi:hypothetical protein
LFQNAPIIRAKTGLPLRHKDAKYLYIKELRFKIKNQNAKSKNTKVHAIQSIPICQRAGSLDWNVQYPILNVQ